MKKIIGVVLAAGQGKRMRSYLPKVVHPVSGLPMVLLVIKALQKAGVERIMVAVGAGERQVRGILPPEVEIINQGKPRGTGHAVKCAGRKLTRYNGDVLVACGDMPLISPGTIKKLISKHRKEKSSVTVLTGLRDDPKGYGRIIRDDNGSIIQITEHGDGSGDIRKTREVNSGMYCFRKQDLSGVLPQLRRKNRQKEFYLTDTIALFAKRGKQIESYIARDVTEIMGINTRQDLAYANMVMNRRILDGHMTRGVSITDPGSTYIDIRARIGRDTVIHPFTVIDGQVNIGRCCQVGPFTHLRSQTVLKDRSEIGNFVEVKKSCVGAGTKAKHLTYLGDTTIGRKVNIGAGTITANYDGKHKHRTIIGDRVFIGSHTTLVAPVTVGRGALTGAGAVVLRNRNIPPGAVVVGMPARVIRKKRG